MREQPNESELPCSISSVLLPCSTRAILDHRRRGLQFADHTTRCPQRFMLQTRLAAAQSKRRATRVRLPPDARQLVNKVVKSRSTNLYARHSGEGSPACGFCKDCTL